MIEIILVRSASNSNRVTLKMILGRSLFIILPSLSLICCRIYPGLCPSLDSPLIHEKESPYHLSPEYLVPYERYQQSLRIFPLNTRDRIFLTVLKDGFLVTNLNHSLCDLELFLSPNMRTLKFEYFLSNENRDSEDLVTCTVLANVSSAVFSTAGAFLIWGCVNFEEDNEHDEAAWLTGNVDMFEAYNESYFTEVLKWALMKLGSESSLRSSDFQPISNDNAEKLFDSEADIEAFCANKQCPVRSSLNTYYLLYFLVVLVFTVLIFISHKCYFNNKVGFI